MTSPAPQDFDALVVGAGIGGLQTALDLAEQGYKVAVVDRDPSIGGKMIRLSKVFPTLDCSSCITTPKMAAAAHHRNITIHTYCEPKSVAKVNGRFEATITQKPRYVIAEKCTGCRLCEYACPTYVPDEEQGGFGARKVIRVPFSNAIPQLAVLDAENCWICGKPAGKCMEACPTDAIDYFQKPQDFTIRARAVVLSTGYELIPDYSAKAFGPMSGHPNLITSLQMERLLAPHGPYMRVLRPGDGKEPSSIAFIQCAGSRDHTLGVPYCSRVCCMYSIKQAMLLSGALPLADITIYYIDIRAFGKNYEQFYQNAQAMGIEFVKAKPSVVSATPEGSLVMKYENQETGESVTREHDMVVQALALVPAWNPAGVIDAGVADDGFLKATSPKLQPTLTTQEGVFMAGVSAGPKDIVDAIVEAGAAAMEVSNYLTAQHAAAAE